MDPNANLLEQERWLTTDKRVDDGRLHQYTQNALHDLRGALTTWLLRGGIEPDWLLAPNAAKYFGRRRTKQLTRNTK